MQKSFVNVSIVVMMSTKELAEEFEETATQLETLALQYKLKGMFLQYDILWHEGVVYRYCALRLREEEHE